MSLTVIAETNPIKVTGTTASRQRILAGPALIRFIKWYNPTTVGHLLALQDENGDNIIECYCDTANVSQTEPVFLDLDGLLCDDMDSGTLYIYLR